MLNSTCCLCGIDLKDKKFDKYYPMKMDDKFYGGRISMSGDIKCGCGRELKGYFERDNNNLKLIDLEVIGDSLAVDGDDTSYIPKKYEEMDYKELQTIAKEKGIEKSNVSREKLLEFLKN